METDLQEWGELAKNQAWQHLQRVLRDNLSILECQLVWNSKTWDQFNVNKGRHEALKEVLSLPERLTEEIKNASTSDRTEDRVEVSSY